MTRKNGHAPMDPLIAALLGRLPAEGQPFPGPDRAKWLEMMAGALDLVYGVEHLVYGMERIKVVRYEGPGSGALGIEKPVDNSPHPMPPPGPHMAHDIYIDAAGYVKRSADDVPVEPQDVDLGEPIYDTRTGSARDRETIVWADGSIGARPGMQFCGPG